MILLNGKSLTPARKIPLEALSLSLKERDSTASMTPADMTGIQVGSWVKDEGNPGAGIVWRVRSISQAYATATPTVTLEHAVSILKDEILFGEHKPAQITGNAKATECTAADAVRYILKRSPEWTLGKFDYSSVRNPYKFDGNTLFEALQIVTDSLDSAWWSYDFSSYPFKLNITKQSTDIGSELRAGRNIKAITRNVDKSGMYTRFYPIGKNNLHIKGDYVERNTGTYGVVSKVETDQSIDTEAELKRWANERLKRHAQPTVTIDVDGLELADATGETMDRLSLGTRCRIPLPEFNTTITERIVALSYKDKLHEPEMVRVTLANTRNDIAKILAEVIRGGGGGGRAAAKKAEEDYAWFEDTNDHVAMCAKGIVGVDAKGNPNWTRMTQLVVDGKGLESTVVSTQKDLVVATSRITQTENNISLVVSDGKIKAASICLAINNGGSSATIEASKIHLLGETIAEKINADYLYAKIAGLPKVDMIQAYASTLRIGTHLAMPNGLYLESNGVWQVKLSKNGDTYTLTEQKLNGSERTVGTFSRATTLTGSWHSGVYTVTASPQGNTINTGGLTVASGQVRRSGNTLYVPVYAGSTNTGYEAWVNVANNMNNISLTQRTNYNGSKYFTAYYLAADGQSYVSMGTHNWYSSGSSVGSITAYY